MSASDERPIIIDTGSLNTKIGFQGNNHPEKEETQYLDDVPFDKYQTYSDAIEYGVIKDFQKMNDETWKYGLFGKLGLTSDSLCDHPILFAETPLAPKSHCELLTQHFFETYNVPGFFIANQGILALYCSGRITGTVVEMGHSRSFVSPIVEGFPLTYACEKDTFISGREMTKHLQQLLIDAQHAKQIQVLSAGDQKMRDDSLFNDLNMVNFVKHEVCLVSSNSLLRSFQDGTSTSASNSSAANGTTSGTGATSTAGTNNPTSTTGSSSTTTTTTSTTTKKKKEAASTNVEKNFTLPDGTILLMSDVFRKRCAEIIFDPYAAINQPNPGIAHTLYNCIQSCEVELRKDLMANIILSGGVSNMNGMQTRLKVELEQLAPSSTMLNVALPSNSKRDESVWCGGSILASLPQMKDLWIRKKDYNEFGPGIIHRKQLS